MALFGSERDASLIKRFNRELINELVDIEVAFYKLSLDDTEANMYDEADNKVYHSPMKINALVDKQDKSYTGDDSGYDITRSATFGFFREDLKDSNIHIEEGDIIEYDNEFGLSIAITVSAHVTRRNRLNIQEVRSGLNRPNNIPRNL